MKKIFVLICLASFVMAGCQPSPEQLSGYVSETLEKIPTQTAYPTYTPENTYTPFPTYTVVPSYTAIIKIVTPTYTSTPLYTATITETPTITPTLTNTPDQTTQDKRPGIYLVGSEIAPGVWRSLGDSDSCYWEVTSRTGDIISNHFGMAGGTMFVPSSGFQVTLESDCGNWTYLGQ